MHLGKQTSQLQLLLGDNIPVQLGGFVNWAGTEQRNEILVVKPRTLSELQKTVRAAVSLGLHVRAVGKALASSPIFPENGAVAVFLEDLVRHDGPRIQVYRNEENPLESELTALSSVNVDELLSFQLNNGVELLANVLNRNATVGRIISTATHGTGLHSKSISDLIVRMRVVDATGELRTYDTTSGPEILAAVRGSLGLFGIIYDVTFRVTPLSVVQVEDRWVPAAQVVYEQEFLMALVQNNVSIEMHWCFMNSLCGVRRLQTLMKKHLAENAWQPHKDEVYVRTVNRPPGPVAPNQEEWFSNRERPSNKVYKARQWMNSRMPASMPMTNNAIVTDWKESFMGTLVQSVPEAINYFNNKDRFPVWHMEFSFDLSEDCYNVYRAIMELVTMVRMAAEQGSFPVNKVSARFTGASDILLSPCYAGNTARGGSGNVCHVEIESMHGTAGWHEFAAQVALRWLQIPGARPNWAKQWYFIPSIIQHIRQTCASELENFRKVLEQYGQDKTRLFFTPCLEQLLYGTTGGTVVMTPDQLMTLHPLTAQPQMMPAQPEISSSSVFGRPPQDSEQQKKRKWWKRRASDSDIAGVGIGVIGANPNQYMTAHKQVVQVGQQPQQMAVTQPQGFFPPKPPANQQQMLQQQMLPQQMLPRQMVPQRMVPQQMAPQQMVKQQQQQQMAFMQQGKHGQQMRMVPQRGEGFNEVNPGFNSWPNRPMQEGLPRHNPSTVFSR